jgi:hypothetical protein
LVLIIIFYVYIINKSKTEQCTTQLRILLPGSSKIPRAELFMRAYEKLPAFRQCIDEGIRSSGNGVQDGTPNGEVIGR